MTVRTHNWCPTCEEGIHDHPTVCTVCGATLTAPPPAPRQQQQQDAAVPAVPAFLTDAIRQAGAELNALARQTSRELAHPTNREALPTIRNHAERLETLRQRMQAILQEEAWQEMLLADLVNPNQANNAQQQPQQATSQATLEALPVTTVHTHSSLFRSVSVSLVSENGNDKTAATTKPTTWQAVPGELGSVEAVDVQGTICCVGTGYDVASLEALAKKDEGADKNNNKKIICFERGGGLTFAQKARRGQDAGACAIVIGNTQTDPWPYIMTDSSLSKKNNQQAAPITIPVCMVSKADWASLQACDGQTLQLQQTRLHPECCVCTEAFVSDHCVCRLPCHHVFHEACVKTWLQKHNTCPYCRHPLPLQDKEAEQERRRDVSRRPTDANAFYG